MAGPFCALDGVFPEVKSTSCLKPERHPMSDKLKSSCFTPALPFHGAAVNTNYISFASNHTDSSVGMNIHARSIAHHC